MLQPEVHRHKVEDDTLIERDIFARNYPGRVPIQTGLYTVCAATLNKEGKPNGGGIIADFNDLEAAEACMREIASVSPAHEPSVWRNEGEDRATKILDWETNTDSTAVAQVRAAVEQVADYATVPAGKYHVTILFTNKKREKEERVLEDIEAGKHFTMADLKNRSIRMAVEELKMSDCDNGHPVEFTLKHEKGRVFGFEKRFASL